MEIYENLVWIREGNTEWLCEEVKEGDSIVLKHAIEKTCKDVEKTIDYWLMEYNTDELKTITLSKLTAYTKKELFKKDILVFETQWKKMQEIKKTAVKKLENSYFAKLDD